MSIAAVALVWIFAASTCLSVALVAVTVPLAVRHQLQRTRGDFGISWSEGRITISRTLTVADLLVRPELQKELRRWARVREERPAEEEKTEPVGREADDIQGELDRAGTERELERLKGELTPPRQLEGPAWVDPREQGPGYEGPGESR
jgi:hypothetical protein